MITKTTFTHKELRYTKGKLIVVVTQEYDCLSVLIINGKYGKRCSMLCSNALEAMQFIRDYR